MPFIPAALLLIGMCLRLAEESPRWYFKQSKVVQAYEGLAKLRNTKIQAARELYEMWFFQLRDDEFTILTPDELKEKKRSVVQLLRDDVLLNPMRRFFNLFPSSNSRLHNATIAASVVMVAQQLSGSKITMYPIALSCANLILKSTWSFFTHQRYSPKLHMLPFRRSGSQSDSHLSISFSPCLLSGLLTHLAGGNCYSIHFRPCSSSYWSREWPS